MEIGTPSPALTQHTTAIQRTALATLVRQFPLPDDGTSPTPNRVRQWVVALATQWLSPQFDAYAVTGHSSRRADAAPTLPLTRVLLLLEQLERQVRQWATALKQDTQKALLLRALTSVMTALRSHLEEVAFAETSSRRGNSSDNETRGDLHGPGMAITRSATRRSIRKRSRRRSSQQSETASDGDLNAQTRDDGGDAFVVDLPSITDWLQQQRGHNDYTDLGAMTPANKSEHLVIDETA